MRGLLISILVFAVQSLAWADEGPVADAGPDQNMYTGDTVYLHGSAYDADGDPIILWSWTVVESPDGSDWRLYDADKPTAEFGAMTAGDYVIALAVLDSHYNGSAPDYVNVHVHDNLPPVAIATADVNSGVAPLTVYFDGNQSYDPEGGSLTYFWNLGDGPDFAETPTTCHTYQEAGQYSVTFTVVDERNAFDTEILIINVDPIPPPHIQAFGQILWCDGSSAVGGQLNAIDQNGHPMTFALTTPPENGSVVIHPDGAFVYRPDAWDGNDSFGFTATDGNIVSNEAFVDLYMFFHADAGRDRFAYIGQNVTLQGSAYDPDGDDIILWSWIVESAPEGSDPCISDTSIPEPSFSGDLAGDYVLALAVLDENYNGSAPDRVLIRVVDVNCRIGDLTGDCRVDIEDLDMFCEQWLKPVDCFGQVGCADLIRDYCVDFDDFAELARDWGI